MTRVDEGSEVDGLDLGRPPRPPLSRRIRRLLTAAVGVLAVMGLVAVLLGRTGSQHGTAPPAANPPTPSLGLAAGPALVRGDGVDQMTVPGGAMFGGAAMNVTLASDESLVTVVRATIPSFDHVHGGRVTDPEIHYGFYLEGAYTSANGRPVQLTLYTARAADTPASTDASVERVLADGVTLVRTDASVYTGTGWWVHGVAAAPDGTDDRAGQVDLLQRLLSDPRLVA